MAANDAMRTKQDDISSKEMLKMLVRSIRMALGILKGYSKQQYYSIQEQEIDLDSEAGEKAHVFQDPVTAEYYRDLYERTRYECRHQFDPRFTWSNSEEKRVVWKNDWYVTFWAFIMFTALDFDRSNLQQALSDNFLDDLGMTTNQLNLGKTINLACFLLAELPSQLIAKKVGAEVWIPTQMVLWSIVSMSQAVIKDANGFYITRGLLGALQGGFICEVCLWLSYFYTSKEMPLRVSLFYVANPLTEVWSSLLAFALLKIKTVTIPEGWKWLFMIEGFFTLLIGIISFFKMPASAVETKAWYRKQGWYTHREEKIVVNRVLRDDPTKGDMNNREPVSLKELSKTLLDVDLLPVYVVRFLADIGTHPILSYLQLLLRKMGFSTLVTNALTIPYNILSIISMFFASWLTGMTNSRALVLAIIPVWILVTLIPLRLWTNAQVNVWGTFALLTLILGHPPTSPITISWCSSNSNSVRSRAVSAALVNMFSQSASIVASNIYREDDAPLYRRGNSLLIYFAILAIIACIVARTYYVERNKQKESLWQRYTNEEKEIYIKTTQDVGNKRLDFRFVY